jgi:hypothetical protein
VAALLDLLHQHAIGKKKLTLTRLKAIEILLKKKLPDLGVETNRGEVAPVTFVFGAPIPQSPTNPAPQPGSSPQAVVAVAAEAAGSDASAAAPFVIGPSVPPETRH